MPLSIFTVPIYIINHIYFYLLLKKTIVRSFVFFLFIIDYIYRLFDILFKRDSNTKRKNEFDTQLRVSKLDWESLDSEMTTGIYYLFSIQNRKSH